MSYRGRWLHLAALCYCNRMLTDGFVPASILASLCPHTPDDPIDEFPEALAIRLIGVGLWEEAERRGITGYQIHDYDDYQPSRREVLSERKHLHSVRSAAGSKGVSKRDANRQANQKANVMQTGKQTLSPVPVPVPVPEDPIKRSTTTGAVPVQPSTSSPLIVSPLRYEKSKESFAFFGSRLRVPHVLHQEFATKLGRYSEQLGAWYLQVNDEVEVSGAPIPDVFAWLRPKFKTWAESLSGDAELARFLSGEV